MKVRVIAHLLMGACLFSAAAYSAAADERALEIIRRADEVRSPNKPFRYTLTIHEFKAGATRPENKQVLDISMRFMKPEGEIKADARSWRALFIPRATRANCCSQTGTIYGSTPLNCAVRFPSHASSG